MGLFSKDIKTMDDLFLHTLQDIYYAENKIVKSLPEMIENATRCELKSGLQGPSGETKGQVQRLDRYSSWQERTKRRQMPRDRRHHRGSRGRHGQGRRQDMSSSRLIAAGTGGRALRDHPLRLAHRLGQANLDTGRMRQVLEQTLSEEKAADKKLTALAERRVNPRSQKGGAKGTSHAGRRASASTGRTAASRRKTTTKKTTTKKKASSRRA